jgi:hypothetical protein
MHTAAAGAAGQPCTQLLPPCLAAWQPNAPPSWPPPTCPLHMTPHCCAAGSPERCQEVWDQAALLHAPLRALLDQAAGLFPAYPRPYLRLLAALVEGPEAGAAALASLHAASIIAVVHDMEDLVVHAMEEPALGPEGGEVQLLQELDWPLARDVVGTRLPQVGRWLRACLACMLADMGPLQALQPAGLCCCMRLAHCGSQRVVPWPPAGAVGHRRRAACGVWRQQHALRAGAVAGASGGGRRGAVHDAGQGGAVRHGSQQGARQAWGPGAAGGRRQAAGRCSPPACRLS